MTTEHATTDKPRGSGTSGADTKPPLRIVRLAFDAQGLALVVMASIAVIFVLDWAQGFLIPLVLGILIAYMLDPLVGWLERIRIHRVAGTSLVMLVVIGALGFGTYSLRGQMQRIIEQLPEAASQVSSGLARLGQGQRGAMQKIQSAASELEQAASAATGIPAKPHGAVRYVIVDDPAAFKTGNVLWAGSMGAMGYVVQVAMVLFLVFFLLLSGNTYKRKLVRLTGPSLSRRKITVQVLDDINRSIQRYMLMLLSTNVLVALLAWIAFRWIGLDNAGAWAVAAGFLHLVPYLGPGLVAIATGMVAWMQFDSFVMALLVAGVWLAIAVTVGTFVTTWMTGRIARMNSAAVFISLLFWGWLWGIWGMFLSVPVIVIVKVVSEHVEPLRPVAELLGE
jgi:predicted PurR-regulated permease PerM